MELSEPAPVRRSFRDERDLPREDVEVRLRLCAVPGDDDMAAAEQTSLAAKGKVDVERERSLSESIRRGEVLLVEPILEIAELDRGGIARIARAGTIVFGNEAPNRRAIRGNPTRHDSSPLPGWPATSRNEGAPRPRGCG